jgi:hypothetical protein
MKSGFINICALGLVLGVDACAEHNLDCESDGQACDRSTIRNINRRPIFTVRCESSWLAQRVEPGVRIGAQTGSPSPAALESRKRAVVK